MKQKPMRQIQLFATVFALGVCLTPNTAQSAILEYSMTWDSVSGTYDGVAFTSQPVTFTFLDVDTAADIVPVSWMPDWNQIRFWNGANVRVSVGGILTNAPMNDTSANTVVLLSTTGSSIGMGYADFIGDYSGDRGYLYEFSTPPVPATSLSVLTSIWSSSASATFLQWDKPFEIGGKYLHVGSTQNTTGTWTVIPEPASLVMMGIFLLAIPMVFLRKRG